MIENKVQLTVNEFNLDLNKVISNLDVVDSKALYMNDNAPMNRTNFYKTEWEANWYDKLEEAIIFYSSSDKHLPPSNTSLYRWLANQFKKYINGELSEERAYQLSTRIPNFELILSKLGFDGKWHNKLEEAIIFYSSSDKHLPPKNNTRLYKWLTSQFKKYINGELSEERAYYLSTCIPNFELILNKYKERRRGKTYSFDERLEEFVQYKIKNKTPIVDWKTPLGCWTNDIRKAYLYNKLSHDKIEKLTKAGFIFNVEDYLWDLKFKRLCEYKSVHKNCNIPANDEAYIDLYRWLIHQKVLYKKNRLPLERQKKLESLGINWNRNHYKWDIKYLKLVEFYNRYGSCDVTKYHEEYYAMLHDFIQDQRALYEKGLLPKYREDKLNEINFIWNYRDYIWSKKCRSARYYLKRYPNRALPKTSKYNNLYAWFKYNEDLLLSNKLDSNKIRRMKSLLALKYN